VDELVEKIGRIGQAYRPIYHMMPHMYASVVYALRNNESFLASTSRRFCKMMKKAKQRVPKATPEEDLHKINFALGQSARMTHSAPYKYKMSISRKE